MKISLICFGSIGLLLSAPFAYFVWKIGNAFQTGAKEDIESILVYCIPFICLAMVIVGVFLPKEKPPKE